MSLAQLQREMAAAMMLPLTDDRATKTCAGARMAPDGRRA